MQVKIHKYRPLHDNIVQVDTIRKAITLIELASIPEENQSFITFKPDEITIKKQLEIIQLATGAIHGNYSTQAGRAKA